MPSDSISVIPTIVLSSHVQLGLLTASYFQILLPNVRMDTHSPTEATCPNYPSSVHTSKLIIVSQKILNRRLCRNDNNKYYRLVFFHLSYGQKTHRILRLVVKVSINLALHHQVPTLEE